MKRDYTKKVDYEIKFKTLFFLPTFFLIYLSSDQFKHSTGGTWCCSLLLAWPCKAVEVVYDAYSHREIQRK